MFSKKESKAEIQFENFDTLIGKNTSFDGVLKAEGKIRIDGVFTGQIEIKGDLLIGESAKISGDISVTNCIVSGEVKGNINAVNLVRITSEGKLQGDVTVKSFIIDEDAFFEGQCKMTNNEKNSSPKEISNGKPNIKSKQE